MALTAIHPGEHLAEELEALDMSAAELARKIDVPTNRVTQILNGTRGITGDTALRFKCRLLSSGLRSRLIAVEAIHACAQDVRSTFESALKK